MSINDLNDYWVQRDSLVALVHKRAIDPAESVRRKEQIDETLQEVDPLALRAVKASSLIVLRELGANKNNLRKMQGLQVALGTGPDPTGDLSKVIYQWLVKLHAAADED
jgi:hypothetical protein